MDVDDTQGQGDYIHDETADIGDVASRSADSDRVMPASDISFGREYILDSSDEQIVDADEDFRLEEKSTDEDKTGDTGDVFAHSEDSTIIRDEVELKKKTQSEFEPVIEMSSDDGFSSEDDGIIVSQDDLGLDGVLHEGEIEFGIEIPEDSSSESSAWSLGDDSSIKPNEYELKSEDSKEEYTPVGEIELGIDMPEEESTSEDSTWVLNKEGSKEGISEFHEDELKVEGLKPLEGEIEFGIEIPPESTSEDSTWVLNKEGISESHEYEIKSEGLEPLEGEIEFGIEMPPEPESTSEDPTLVLNTGSVGIIDSVLDEQPAADLNMDEDFGIEPPELIIDSDQLEIGDFDLDNPPGASEDITVVYGSDTARQGAADKPEIELPVVLPDDIDFDMQEDHGAVEDITLDYSGVDLSKPDTGELDIEPAMEPDLQEGEPQEGELKGLELELDIPEDEGIVLGIDDTDNSGAMESEGLQVDMGLDMDAGELALEADSELVLEMGGLEIDGIEGEELSVGSMDIELDESEAPTYISDYDSEKSAHLEPASVTEGFNELDDAEGPTLLAGNESASDGDQLAVGYERLDPKNDDEIDYADDLQIDVDSDDLDVELKYDTEGPTLLAGHESASDDDQLAVEYESLDPENDDEIDYADGLQIDVDSDDLDVELKYDSVLSLESDELDAGLKHDAVQSWGDEEKTAVFGQKIQQGNYTDNNVSLQSDHYLDVLSLDDNKDGDVYDLSDDEGLDIADDDDDDFSFSSIEGLSGDIGSLNEFNQFKTEESGLGIEESGLDLDIEDKLEKTIVLDDSMSKKDSTVDNEDDDTIKIKNSNDR
ncbi:hypothetical protein MBAV_004386 [Candidatus Magnetobacterium bavaricum]|uniref:Uncharacterized protein n=1 Tax=Candidatus Magnetobacterium bavaricum TaxID=29290 RepID=A0A0F3GN67_9BACT|nr:hypothetical protein MBAV_004386 [Candidatus Magnetobacterium bavaricum]